MTFGADTTTDEVLDGVDLTDKLAVITGGASGLGQETARALSAKGAKIVLPVRDLSKGEAAVQEIRAHQPKAQIDLMACELGSFASIRAFAEEFNAKHDRIDLLINNAGVMACPFDKTEDGFEMQFGVCHLGHFLLTNLLTPALINGAPARIVNLSSRGHHLGGVHFDDLNFESRPYEKWGAYGQAKTANILFAVGLEQRLSPRGIHAYAVHPGIIMTRLGRHLSEQDIEQLRANVVERGGEFKPKSVEAGAATTVFAATAPELTDRGGIYLEDCHVSDINDDPKASCGVRSYALDQESAQRLWSVSEKLVGQTFNTV